MRALVVDDELNIRRTLAVALESMGYEATTAATGADALGELKARRFDVMLLDHMLTGRSGIEVAHRQQARGHGRVETRAITVVSLARWILGEPSHVLARSKLIDGVDMTTSALLQFAGGQTASVWASFESPEEQELTVVTRESVTRLERPFNSPDEADPYQLMVESFAESVLHDRPLAIPPSESIANMRVLDRIREAAANP